MPVLDSIGIPESTNIAGHISGVATVIHPNELQPQDLESESDARDADYVKAPLPEEQGNVEMNFDEVIADTTTNDLEVASDTSDEAQDQQEQVREQEQPAPVRRSTRLQATSYEKPYSPS